MIQNKNQPQAESLSLGPPRLWIEHCGLTTGESMLDSGKDMAGEYAYFDALLLFPKQIMRFEAEEVVGREKEILQLFEEFVCQPWFNALGDAIEAQAWRAIQEKYSIPLPLVLCALSYELGAQSHEIEPRLHFHSAPALWAARYPSVYLWDRKKREGWIVGADHRSIEALKVRILQAHDSMNHTDDQSKDEGDFHGSCFEPQCTFETYQERFNRLQDRLLDGDIYQMNLTIPLSFKLPEQTESISIFKKMWAVNSGQFNMLIQLDADQSILSLSPERLVKWDREVDHDDEERYIETAPIKGTRPRRSEPKLDQKERDELVSCLKDQAEHVMILDLERNDLGRICKSGSVQVVMDREIRSYATVHHLVSVVRGQLLPNQKLSDILKAIFPGGSVTGAPKRRAMALIRRLEFGPRGIYCGALGYIDPLGGGDLNLPIRTLVKNKDTLLYHSGGGVVIDSSAQGEWDELWVKTIGFERGLTQATDEQ
jgi:anthranilate/para-aminobenzoate synthase component I